MNLLKISAPIEMKHSKYYTHWGYESTFWSLLKWQSVTFYLQVQPGCSIGGKGLNYSKMIIIKLPCLLSSQKKCKDANFVI